MPRNRVHLQRIYNRLYTKCVSDYCAYCGDGQDVYDHVPALTWVGSLGTEYFRQKGIPLLLIPACSECNLLLGAVGLFEIDERRAYVSGALKDRYRSLLQYNGDCTTLNIQKNVAISRIRFADSDYDLTSYVSVLDLSDETDEKAEAEELWERYRPGGLNSLNKPRRYRLKQTKAAKHVPVKRVEPDPVPEEPSELFNMLCGMFIEVYKKNGQK